MKRRLAQAIVRFRIPLMLLIVALTAVSVYSMRFTKVNYDLTAYLADDTDTKRGLEIMRGEFIPTAGMSVVLVDATEEETDDFCAHIGDMEGVMIASYDHKEGTKRYNGSVYRLISVTTEEARAREILDTVEAELGDRPCMISGDAKNDRNLQQSIAYEMPIVLAVSCGIVLLILLSLTSSYIIPLIFFAAIFSSILLNLGTNWVMGSVSYITFSITAILQLALAMDYSIMMINSYDRLRRTAPNNQEAMLLALQETLMPISSSSLTTIAGMMSMTTMSFTIGIDVGVVLTKGILFSLLTVFLFLPGALLLFTPLIDKTAHPPLKLTGGSISALMDVLHSAVPILLILVSVVCMALQGQNVYTYSVQNLDDDTRTFGLLFGQSNQMVVLFPRDESDAGIARQQELIDRLSAVTLEDRPIVQKALSMVTTGKDAITYYDAASAAALLGRGEFEIETAFSLLHITPPIRGDELLARLSDLVYTIGFLLPDEPKIQVAEAKSLLQTANLAFNGENYSRILLSLDLPLNSEHIHEKLAEMKEILHDVYGPDTAMAGMLLVLDDTALAFSGDMQRVSYMTIILVFIIVLLSFRNLLIPTVLVCLIQSAIWINMCFSSWYDGSIYFLCYLICVGLQMGATIDYGILLTQHYLDQRREYPPRQAAARAIGLSIKTIVISGMVLVVAGFSVGMISSVFYTSSIGTMLGRGALISVGMVLLLLPRLLRWLDRWIVPKKTRQLQKEKSEAHSSLVQ